MELIEKPNLKAVQYLNSITYETFKNDYILDAANNGYKKPVEKDIKTYYTNLKQFCKTNIKTKGVTKRIYAHSLNTPAGLGGRLFSGGSMQGIWGGYRGLLMRDIATDIDQSNAHPVILRYVCHKHNIDCPSLEYYINHRDKCLSEFSTRTIGKKIYLVATNEDKTNRSFNLPLNFKKYDKEMKSIQKELILLPDYKELFETIPEYKLSKNYNGSAVNRILCYYENIILQHALHIINNRGLEPAILMFDGCMIYGDHYQDETLLEEITNYVNEKMPNLNMKWAYKPNDETVQMPDDFDENNIEGENETNSNIIFKKLSEDFEKTYLKITKRGFYIEEEPDATIIKTREQMIKSYDHMECGKSESGHPVKFIDKWINCNNNIRRKDHIGIYPDASKCPENIFNMWKPFYADLLTGDYTPNIEVKDLFFNHIKILCGNNENVYQYIIKWIAHLIKYPWMKSTCPTFITKQGAGKGTLIKCLTSILGDKRVFCTARPSRDVWGAFNEMMATKYLINLNELSRSETKDSEEQIKGLITDPKLIINGKGVPQYEIDSYHKFIITSNNAEPIKTSEDDRRNVIICGSNEKIGDSAYFIKFDNDFKDINVIRTIADAFKNIEVREDFLNEPIPENSYHNNLKENSKSYVYQWLEYIVQENRKKLTLEFSANSCFILYTKWCEGMGFKTDGMNVIKLGKHINILFGNDYDTYINKKKNHGTRINVFDIPLLIKFFKIEDEAEDDKDNNDHEI